MRRLTVLLERGSVAIDETSWRRWRGRVALVLLALAGMLAVQTALLQSPDYIINGLYHNRRAINLQLQTMPASQKAKLMERLCLAGGLFEAGGSDPYQIPNAEACAKLGRGEKPNVAP
jgi:hypothetical protein